MLTIPVQYHTPRSTTLLLCSRLLLCTIPHSYSSEYHRCHLGQRVAWTDTHLFCATAPININKWLRQLDREVCLFPLCSSRGYRHKNLCVRPLRQGLNRRQHNARTMKMRCCNTFLFFLLLQTAFVVSMVSAWQQQHFAFRQGTVRSLPLSQHPSSIVRRSTFLQSSRSSPDASSSPVSTPTPTSISEKRRHATSLSSTIPHDPPIVVDDTVYELADHQPNHPTAGFAAWADEMLSTYWGPRILLAVLAAVYATNFPLGALMNDHLPSSAATASRMFVAALALGPFIPRLKPELRVPAVLCGFFTATGYVTQSLALTDVDPARVSFLGSATVLWCPLLEGWIEKKPMGLKDAPQTWLAALLCMTGIGVLELSESAMSLSMTWGDALALLQAVGFGTGVFWTSRMLRNDSSQALPVTATLIATTAFLSVLWCVADGWMNGAVNPDWFSLTLPGMAMDESMRPVLGAVLWTGLISTSLNFFVELTALGKVPPSEASVLLASEPLWAALFAATFYGSELSMSDGLGGILIVAACLVNALVSPDLLQPSSQAEQEKST